jgi:hypothetical protein
VYDVLRAAILTVNYSVELLPIIKGDNSSENVSVSEKYYLIIAILSLTDKYLPLHNGKEPEFVQFGLFILYFTNWLPPLQQVLFEHWLVYQFR